MQENVSSSFSNATQHHHSSHHHSFGECSNGMLLPFTDESNWRKSTRIIIYFIALMYLFAGIAVGTHVFMNAIVNITSQEVKISIRAMGKKRRLKQQNKRKENVETFRNVRIWNPTIANVTLMALGTSAAEIMLSIIQCLANGFKAGEIGPGSIVGSAAFNQFFIIGICILSVPVRLTRKISRFSVYVIATGFNVLAYVWLIIILNVISPNVVESWEAGVTFGMFGAFLACSYLADKQPCKLNVGAAHSKIAESSTTNGSAHENGNAPIEMTTVAGFPRPSRQISASGLHKISEIDESDGDHAVEPTVIPEKEEIRRDSKSRKISVVSCTGHEEVGEDPMVPNKRPGMKMSVALQTDDDSILVEEFNAKDKWYQIWRKQILESIEHDPQVGPGHLIDHRHFLRYLKHIITFGWGLIYGLVPPPSIFGGYPCFFVSMCVIALKAALIGDVASIFGCLLGIGDMITAITFVAVGTSLPELFASRFAAYKDSIADNAIGNINGSNCVNVFFGLGLPWLISAIYWESSGQKFEVPAGNLAPSVIIYMGAMALFWIILSARRVFGIFGKAELGGPIASRIASAVLLILIWLLYLVASSLDTYRLLPINI